MHEFEYVTNITAHKIEQRAINNKTFFPVF